MTDVVIAGAARTPVGAFNGGLSAVPAHELGVVAIKAALERSEVSAEEVDEVVLGQVLTAGEGQNPARQAAIGADHRNHRLQRRGRPHMTPLMWNPRDDARQ